MLQLNLPTYDFNVKKHDEKYQIYDSWRKRFVALTPEEWVRQHFLHFLVSHRGFPSGLLAVEKELKINGMSKRCDAIVYDRNAAPRVIVELKAPSVQLTQKVCDQVAIYNSKLCVDFFIVSNGLQHIACRVHSGDKAYQFLPDIPHFDDLIALL